MTTNWLPIIIILIMVGTGAALAIFMMATSIRDTRHRARATTLAFAKTNLDLDRLMRWAMESPSDDERSDRASLIGYSIGFDRHAEAIVEGKNPWLLYRPEIYEAMMKDDTHART